MPLAMLVAVAVILPACSRPGPSPAEKIQPGDYTLSQKCGACHRDIYAGWASSMHATSGTNVHFRRAFEEALAIDRAQAETLCAQCHSPAQSYGAKNLSATESKSEGIGCDFCHSITASDPARRDRPYQLDLGPVKRGPIKDADSTAHQAEYSDLHVNSVMCAGCHEYSTDKNVPILSTFSEWQASSYAREGVNCQRCHMPYLLGDVVEPRVKRVAGVAVNLHQMPGGHSRQMMYKALRASIASVNRDKGRLNVSVEIANVGTGHSVPTGIATRKVVLTVEVTSEKGEQQRRELSYERRVVDAQGKLVERDSELFTRAAAIQSDTRLVAGQSRLEKFEFSDYPGENLTVQARLTYVYSPHARKETEVRFDFFSEEKHLVSQFIRKP